MLLQLEPFMPLDNSAKDRQKTLNILAEGDSWFSYPRQFFFFGKPSNIIHWLKTKPHLKIKNLSNPGDDITGMISCEQKLKLLKEIKTKPYDVLLLSGGGNDLLGKEDLEFILRSKSPGTDVLDCIHNEYLFLKLSQIEMPYQEIISRALQVRPELRIITHCYDQAPPSNIGFRLFDWIPMGRSWIKPYLEEKNILLPEEQRQVIQYLLLSLRGCLSRVQDQFPDHFQVIDTQGLLQPEHWRNEIHPNPEGFRLVSERIYREGLVPLLDG